MHFMNSLQAAWQRNHSLVCVGLDPEPAKFPAHLKNRADAVFEFCAAIVDATADVVCTYKPQIAHFAALRAEEALERLVAHIHARHPSIPVILDAKRGDIGSTSQAYARALFDVYGADAVTAQPYLGYDALEPLLSRADRGVFVLCRTSNPGASELQDLFVRAEDGQAEPLYLRVARRVANEWNADGNCGLVVGATYPEELRQVREIVGDLPILAPGVGAQGGDLEATVRAGIDSVGQGLLLSVSRAVLYASSGDDFASAARRQAGWLRMEIERQRGGPGSSGVFRKIGPATATQGESR